MKYSFSNSFETVIIFGTYGRGKIAQSSLNSLSKIIKDEDVKLIVSDASKTPSFSGSDQNDYIDDYIWTPRFTSMATSRNIAYALAKEKYCFDWIMFVEDDIKYNANWYRELINFSRKVYGKISPLGFAYGCFTASPYGVKKDDTSLYDENYDCYSGMFGVRADQRLYKSCLYENIARFWDPDLLGISSCQTGKQSHRLTMNGFGSGSIGHRKLCEFVEDEQSTWVGQRDIGPAAFDKRLSGHKAITNTVKNLQKISINNQEPNELNYKKTPLEKKDQRSYQLLNNEDGNYIPMTGKVKFELPSLRVILRRFYKALRIIIKGNA